MFKHDLRTCKKPSLIEAEPASQACCGRVILGAPRAIVVLHVTHALHDTLQAASQKILIEAPLIHELSQKNVDQQRRLRCVVGRARALEEAGYATPVREILSHAPP
jgi:hypothetical protein